MCSAAVAHADDDRRIATNAANLVVLKQERGLNTGRPVFLRAFDPVLAEIKSSLTPFKNLTLLMC
jgi:hypothetical protein